VAYNILAVLSADEPGSGVMYPMPSESRTLMWEDQDGKKISTFPIKGLSVLKLSNNVLQPVLGSNDLSAEGFVSLARVVVRSSHFDQVKWTADNSLGALNWGPGLEVLDLTLTKALRSVKNRNRLMVGHVRFRWLRSVGFQMDPGKRSVKALRLQLVTGTRAEPRHLILQLILPNEAEASPQSIARVIARRAAAFRLTHGTQLGPEERSKLQELANVDLLEPKVGHFVHYQLPTFHLAKPETAFPRPAP
jgi:hypothetical protein